MLNNMDLNSQDSFYSQFENCNSSAIGMETHGSKDSQDVFMDSGRTAPAQFAHGKFLTNPSSIHYRPDFSTAAWNII